MRVLSVGYLVAALSRCVHLRKSAAKLFLLRSLRASVVNIKHWVAQFEDRSPGNKLRKNLAYLVFSRAEFSLQITVAVAVENLVDQRFGGLARVLGFWKLGPGPARDQANHVIGSSVQQRRPV